MIRGNSPNTKRPGGCGSIRVGWPGAKSSRPPSAVLHAAIKGDGGAIGSEVRIGLPCPPVTGAPLVRILTERRQGGCGEAGGDRMSLAELVMKEASEGDEPFLVPQGARVAPPQHQSISG